MSDLLAQAAARFGALPFLISDDTTFTFAEVEAAVEELARSLAPRRNIAFTPAIAIVSVIEILATIRAESRSVLIPPSWPVDLAAQCIPTGEADTPEVIVFTSGSAGRPKAVRLSEKNWQAAGVSSTNFYGFGPEGRWLLVLPLFHVSGLSIIFRALVSGGAALLSPRLEPEALDEADFASLVPAQLRDAVEKRSKPPRAEVVVGGGALPSELVARAQGWTIHRTYGMSETAAVVASGPPQTEWMTALPGVDISVADQGLLQIRGAQVSPGYADDSERGPNDWFVTSDFGKVQGDQVAVTGRADRMINTGGEKVDPAEVESLLLSHPEVADVYVFGQPDERWGEAVAVVYTGSAAPNDLAELVSEHLGPHARPRRIERVDEIPRTELGKANPSFLRKNPRD